MQLGGTTIHGKQKHDTSVPIPTMLADVARGVASMCVSHDAEVTTSTTGTPGLLAKTVTIDRAVSATIEIAVDVKNSNGSYTECRLYYNGSQVGGLFETTSTSYVTVAQTLTFADLKVVDVFQLYIRTNSGTSTAFVANLRFYIKPVFVSGVNS